MLIEDSHETLFETIIEPRKITDEYSKKDFSEGEVETIFRKKNKVSVGKPIYYNLFPKNSFNKVGYPNEIINMLNNYDFHFVSLCCSFLPDSNCKFNWVRFGIELFSESESNSLIEERPIAFDMYPDEILNETKLKKDLILTPKLKIGLNIIDSDLKYGQSEEFIQYEPQILGFGLRTSSVVWDFKKTKNKEIGGNQKDLFLIVKTPKKSKVKGKFEIGAELEVYLDRWIPIPFAKSKKDKIVNTEYYLTDLR